MGLWEFLRQWQRGRLVAGVTASLLVHVLLAWCVLWGLKGELQPHWVPKRGDTIIVELPKPEEPASAGSPTAPPAAVRPPAPPPAPSSTVRSTPPPAPPPREERRVAVAPRPAEPVTPARPEPTRPIDPAPRSPEPAPHAAEPPARAPEPPARAPEPSATTPEPAAPAPATAEPAPRAPAPAAPHTESAQSQVAALPPRGPTAPSASDVRAALRRGAGGHGQGRGGIEGDAIPLDSEDVRYSDYLEQVRRRIKDKWGFPCVRKPGGECQGHTTSLDVQFGILKDGRLQFVEIIRAADHEIYDEYALNAIRLAQPFPPVPAVLVAAMRQGSTGVAIKARFIYVAETSLTNLLR